MDPVRYFNLVFDIDNVLADTAIDDPADTPFYEKHGLVLTAIKTHYVFPGVIELMQLLFQTPDVRVSFFSSGAEERNIPFVEQLLIRALGEGRYAEVKGSVRIFSGKRGIGSSDLLDLDSDKAWWDSYHKTEVHSRVIFSPKVSFFKSKSENTHHLSMVQFDKYGIYYNSQKKSLAKVFGENNNLDNTVLIDDQPSVVMYGEEKHYLFAPHSLTNDYSEMAKKSAFFACDPLGHWMLRFEDCTNYFETAYCRDAITNGEFFGIRFEGEKCVLAYTDALATHYQELTLLPDLHSPLIAAAKAHLRVKVQGRDHDDIEGSVTMTQDETVEALRALIREQGGKMTRVDLECNRICYIAGLLFKAMEHARAGSTLADCLFSSHFVPKREGESFDPRYSSNKALHLKEELYFYGLEQLRRANPRYTFITPQIYKDALISAAERDVHPELCRRV